MGIDEDIRFNPEELKEIRKVSLARILCDNTEGMNKMQPQAFLTSNSRDNKEVSCDDTTNIPKLDITPFRGVGSAFTPTIPTSTPTTPTATAHKKPEGNFFFTTKPNKDKDLLAKYKKRKISFILVLVKKIMSD